MSNSVKLDFYIILDSFKDQNFSQDHSLYELTEILKEAGANIFPTSFSSSKILRSISIDTFTTFIYYDLDYFLKRYADNYNNPNMIIMLGSSKYLSRLDNKFYCLLVSNPEDCLNKKNKKPIIGLDADGVIFSDESEKISMISGLEKFSKNEIDKRYIPLSKGPLFNLTLMLSELNKKSPDLFEFNLYTSRDLASSYRVKFSLLKYGIVFDQMYFLNGDKLKQFIKNPPTYFFDDKQKHIDSSIKVKSIGIKVLYGISYLDEKHLIY